MVNLSPDLYNPTCFPPRETSKNLDFGFLFYSPAACPKGW
jgi:hypothetical protein